MDSKLVEQFSKRLLEWYEDNARILPWREEPSPYRVWISEIMLQQTRVEAVKSYFERFMTEAPTIEALAAISEEQLLKLWEGLGYYSRARNLKKAAIMIMEQFGGQLPDDVAGLQSLPGIGPYSSGAIASIAFGKKATAIDGNVLRVMARITANQGDITNQKVKKEIDDLVWELLPEQRVGDFNQALMELGAMVCLPNGAPKCMECPVPMLCKGQRQGIAEELPVKPKKKARKIEKRTVYIIGYGENIALRQRPGEGLLAGLWEFPNSEGHLTMEESKLVLLEWGIAACDMMPIQTSKHIFTHLEWHMIGYHCIVKDLDNNQLTWVTKESIKKQYSVPTAFKAYIKLLDEGEEQLRLI